jgi:hypothetical protein
VSPVALYIPPLESGSRIDSRFTPLWPDRNSRTSSPCKNAEMDGRGKSRTSNKKFTRRVQVRGKLYPSMRGLFSSLVATVLLFSGSSAQTTAKVVTIFVEGDSSSLPKFINVCRQSGPERGLDIRFVDKKDDVYDYRVVLSTEGSGVWDYAHGNIVVMNSEAKVLFTVTRANRFTSKGTTNALSKEFVKSLPATWERITKSGRN